MEALKTMHAICGEIGHPDNFGNEPLWIHKSVEHSGNGLHGGGGSLPKKAPQGWGAESP